MNSLFVPFSDLTSGTRPIAAGRYLDLVRERAPASTKWTSTRVHPYCYYNPLYECPYPPAENLEGSIRADSIAGEKLQASNARERSIVSISMA